MKTHVRSKKVLHRFVKRMQIVFHSQGWPHFVFVPLTDKEA